MAYFECDKSEQKIFATIINTISSSNPEACY